jgi:hypothetical protein
LVIEAPELSGDEAGELSVLGLGFEEADVDLLEVEDCGAPMENEQAPAIKTRDKPARVTRAIRTRTSSM